MSFDERSRAETEIKSPRTNRAETELKSPRGTRHNHQVYGFLNGDSGNRIRRSKAHKIRFRKDPHHRVDVFDVFAGLRIAEEDANSLNDLKHAAQTAFFTPVHEVETIKRTRHRPEADEKKEVDRILKETFSQDAAKNELAIRKLIEENLRLKTCLKQEHETIRQLQMEYGTLMNEFLQANQKLSDALEKLHSQQKKEQAQLLESVQQKLDVADYREDEAGNRIVCAASIDHLISKLLDPAYESKPVPKVNELFTITLTSFPSFFKEEDPEYLNVFLLTYRYFITEVRLFHMLADR
jgi:hypothetical protein